MPHAEYPSGSGCICQAVMELVDAFVAVSGRTCNNILHNILEY